MFLLLSCNNNIGSNGELYSVEGIIEGIHGPISNAKVTIDNDYNWTRTTLEDGSFIIDKVSKGEHELYVTKDYDSSFVERNYTISVNTDLLLDPILLPSPLTISNTEIKQTLTSNMIILEWSSSDAEDFREYKLFRHTTSGLDETTGELIHVSTLRSDTTFTDSIPHFSKYYYRVYQMNDYGRLGGSNIVEVQTETFQNEPILDIGNLNVRYLNQGETMWLYFSASEGEIYKIIWDHIDWSPGFIAEVSCYREDSTTVYFEREIVVPHLSSPKTIVAEANEKVYIKVEAQTSNIEGIFRILISHLLYEEAQEIMFDNPVSIPIDIGETILYYFNAIADTQYQVNLYSEMYSSAIYVKVSAYRERMNFAYFYEEFTGSDVVPKSLFIESVQTERIYIILTGGYYFYATTIDILVSQTN